MAIKKCKECGKEVSTKADACPNCGVSQKRKSIGCGGLLLLLIFLGVVGSFMGNNDSSTSSSSSKTTKQEKQKSPEEIRKDQIESTFSSWDGSHRNLSRLIKESMNDPDSYDHIETVYSDKGDHLIVRTTFRGKNAFNAVVKNTVVAKTDLRGNVLEIISQGQ